MTALQPGMVRGIRVFRLLQRAPWYWLHGKLAKLHGFSEQVSQIDAFLSHSWHDVGWLKYVNMLYLSNGSFAFWMSTLSSLLAMALFQDGQLGFNSLMTSHAPSWVLTCRLISMVPMLITLFRVLATLFMATLEPPSIL